MSNQEERIAELEGEMQDHQPNFDAWQALERLFKNKDFQEVILTGYMQNEAVRLVHFKASAEAAYPDKQFQILRDIDSIGALREYFKKLKNEGEYAQQTIANAEFELQHYAAGD